MESPWSSFLVVAAVFAAFSGAASAWGRVQRRKRDRQQAAWQALLQPEATLAEAAAARLPEPAAAPEPARARRRRALPPDPSFADSPSFVSDSDSRRAALDDALDRMSRQNPAPPGDTPARHGTGWEDTEPSVTLSVVLPHGVGRRAEGRGSQAA